MSDPLLEVEDLTIQYETEYGPITAVSNASFTIDQGEYFGLAGESGCGKSTIARAILGGLDSNGEVVSGTMKLHGEEIQDYDSEMMNERIRWKEISFIPQSAMNSLDPLMRIEDQAQKLASIHSSMSDEEALDNLREMFEIVGIQQSRISDYPHQFSGGMQQRAIIAMALFLEPSLLIADEPTTALDVIMQDQVFKYLDEVKETLGTSMLLITHDISLIFENCDKLAIMHSGQIAESGQIENLMRNPRHPYSILLQESFPSIEHPERELTTIEGSPPSIGEDVDFCTFVDRCPWAVDECHQHAPPHEPVGDNAGEHKVSCFRSDEVHELYESGQDPPAAANSEGGER